MEVISTNISRGKSIEVGGRSVQTGIHKVSIPEGITLEAQDVQGDVVVDREHHGGIDKACYLFGLQHYASWKLAYPDLNWTHGMFGENLTVSLLEEGELKIGSTYRLGETLIQISQPRQPCFKFGHKMGSPTAIKKMVATGHCGAYVRVLTSGLVKCGDRLEKVDSGSEWSIAQVFRALFEGCDSKELEAMMACELLAESCRRDLQKRRDKMS